MKKNIGFARRFTSYLLGIIMVLSCTTASLPYFSSIFGLRASAENTAGSQQTADNPRIDVSFNNNWDFHLGDANGAHLKAFKPIASEWNKVTLPHDFSISQDFTTSGTEGESGNKLGGTGWYRKWFTVPEAFNDREIILNFDGAYMHTYVYVNGTLVCENHYGYNSFSVDITDYIASDGATANLIAVKVVNDIPSSRWYSGSGISRDVTISMLNKTHVAQYGARVLTPDVQSGKGTAQAEITVRNDSYSQIKAYVKAEILDSDGNAVSPVVTSDRITIDSNSETAVTLSPKADSFKLWSVGDPNLYTLRVIVSSDEQGTKILDDYKVKFGYRYINWDSDTGFSINGVNTKIKGACMHNDQGALGAVQEYDAIYRQIKILKEYGFNAVRTSHNVSSSVLLDICDELGMLVMEEFFDGWSRSKNSNSKDFSTYFDRAISSDNKILGASAGDKWYKFVTESTVKRDRNRPSIIIWSAGNELNQMAGGYNNTTDVVYAQAIKEAVSALDSRPLTEGNNNKSILGVDAYMDVLGGNYYPAIWAKTITTDKPIVLTESSSALTSRGFYKSLGKSGYELSAYDTYAPSWGDSAEANLYYTSAFDRVSGEFIWTGFDYIGEPTPWNNQTSANANGSPISSFFGVIDTAGFAKDNAYLYKSIWDSGEHTLNLLPGTWDSSKLSSTTAVPVAVYTDAGYVELYMNDTLIGHAQSETVTTGAGYTYRKWTTYSDNSNCTAADFTNSSGNGAAAPDAMYPQFKVKWQSGTLSVKAWTDSTKSTEITDSAKGTKIAYSSQTIGSVKAEVWGTNGSDSFTGTADGKSYAYIEYTALDTNGNFMNDYNGTLTIEAKNGVKIVGVDNGKQSDWSRFQESSVLTSDGKATIKMYNGRALVIVKTTDTATDNGTVAASCADGTIVNGINVTSVAESGDELYDEFEEICPQTETVYEPTIYDKFDVIKENVDSLSAPITSADGYTYFEPTGTGDGRYIEDGTYIIYNPSPNYYSNQPAAMSNVSQKTGYLNSDSTVSLNSTVLTSAADNEYTFTYVSDSKYYIQDSTGKYLNIGSTNSTLSLSDTPQALNVYVYSNKRISIYSGGQFVDMYSNSTSDGRPFSTWATTVTNANNNNKFSLYKKPSSSEPASEGRTALYNALKYGAQHNPVLYSFTSAKAFIEAMESGLNVYNDENSTEAQLVAAAKAINDAIAGLGTEIRKLPATLYKYGYSNAGSAQNYSAGGSYMNKIAYSQMKKRILADNEIMDQIKNIIGYDDTSWADGYADTALEQAVNAYAKIYNLAFTSDVVCGGNRIQEVKSTAGYTDIGGNNIFPTMWNNWDKTGTMGSTDNNRDEGASVMGLFSPTLSNTGIPESHAEYPNALPYINKSSASNGINSNLTLNVNTDSSNTKTVTLVPLTGISVNVPDFFTQEDVGTDTADTYAKYHWATEFPFVITTNRYGVNTYDYDSSDTTRLFRAKYDDETHTAVSNLVNVENYSIVRAAKGNGTGFFPFNYQMSDSELNENGDYIGTASSFSSENAIYHFGMTFNTEFNIPRGGVYSGNTPINFNFSGDDDVLVYVDNTLVLDNGGLHGARSCSIDFTNKAITYQFAWSAETNTLLNSADDVETVTYTYQPDGDYSKYDYTDADGNTHSISADIKSALAKLNAISGDGSTHRLGFFYLERGSTDSNCKIQFNLQQTSTNVRLVDQTLVADYGHPVNYNITENNVISEAAVNAGAKFDYIGVTKANLDVDNITDFANGSLPEGSTHFADKNTDYSVSGLKYGSGTVNAKGDITYSLSDMNFTGADSYYVAAKVIGDPTFSLTSEYIQYEKVRFIPASTIYFEDNALNSTAISYKGNWTTAGNEIAGIKQAADLMEDKSANAYGYDPFYADKVYSRVYYDSDGNVTSDVTSTPAYYTSAGDGSYSAVPTYYNTKGKVTSDVYYKYAIGGGYTSTKTYYDNDGNIVYSNDSSNSLAPAYAYAYAYDWFETNVNNTYSAGSAHKVTVSAADNPRKGGTWPTAEFTFTGTGFDVISLTDSTTGLIKVEVKSADGTFSQSYAVDTYYGYSYGRVYADKDGNATLVSEGNTPLYWSAKNDGSVSTTVAYYDSDGKVTNENTGNIAYCETWLAVSDSESLYQIPVIKILGLDYNKYNVTITPMYSSAFNHRADGVKSYDFYLDAIRIYDPALNDSSINLFYKYDGEGYPEYMELKDLLLDAGKLTSDPSKDTQGVVFIDGIRNADSRTDMSKYKNAGPNNELYLMGGSAEDESGTVVTNGQAVAFSIWATEIPQDIQIAAKSAKGNPILKIYTVSSDNEVNSAQTNINSASDVYYSFNKMLPQGGKLTWTRVKGADGNYYYKTGTIILQNASLSENDILSLTNLKWTFDTNSGMGQFELSVDDASGAVVSDSVSKKSVSPVLLSANYNTRSVAFSAAKVAQLDMSVIDGSLSVQRDKVYPGYKAEFSLDTYTSVEKIKITDSLGNEVEADASYTDSKSDSDEIIRHWNVSFIVKVPGEHKYYVSGTDKDGYTTDFGSVTVTYNVVEKPAVKQLLDNIIELFKRIINFFSKLFSGFYTSLGG